jgi:hypothetical protein
MEGLETRHGVPYTGNLEGDREIVHERDDSRDRLREFIAKKKSEMKGGANKTFLVVKVKQVTRNLQANSEAVK